MDDIRMALAQEKINDRLASAAQMRRTREARRNLRHPFPRHAIAEQMRRFADRLDS